MTFNPKGSSTPLTSSRRAARASVAIRRADDERILLLPDGTLPTFDVDPAVPWQVVAAVTPSIRERVGVEVVTLRAAWVSDTADERLYDSILVGGEVPPGAAWWERDALPERLARAGASAGLTSAIGAGALVPSDGAHQGWYRPGWLETMTAWADARLADAGLRRRGAYRQIRSWGRSALLQVDTDRGLVWAKAVPVAFAHEIAVTGLLADVDPGLVPPVIAADPAGGRLLLAHVAGPSLAEVEDPAAWIATMERLAEIQRVLAAERGRLSVAGVATASLASLADDVPEILTDGALLRAGEPGGLTEAGHVRLRRHAERIADACRRMAGSGVPDSLDHGDLGPSQVIVGEMGPVIFDWSDASVTHPFLALESFVSGPPMPLAPDRATLTTAYLEPWSVAGDDDGARAAADLAWLVLPFHLARIHRDRVLPGLEQPWEMDRVVPDVLQRLADRLASGPGAG